MQRLRPAQLALVPLTALLLCALLGGCAALTNPVMDGLPVRRLPPELLAESQEDKKTIPLHWLRQAPPEKYQLAPGDVLGVWIQGVLGTAELAPPVQFPGGNLPPALGFPIPIREDGTISLPFIDPVEVRDMTIADAEKALRHAYTVKKKIFPPGQERIIVTLLRPREHHVLIIRQDAASSSISDTSGIFGASRTTTSGKRGSGHVVDLPAYENDVLNALAKSGGFPGLDTTNEIIIHRGRSRRDHEPADVRRDWEMATRDGKSLSASAGSGETVRIPLRLRPGESPSFKPEDVILRTGDTVFIESRDTGLFYTGGLLPVGEHVLPRDRDLNVVQAVAVVRGPLLNAGFGVNVSGTSVAGGIGGPNPSLLTVLRRTPGGGQIPIRVNLNRALRDPRERILVKAGDMLILQETPGEAMARYFTQQLNFTVIWRVFDRRDATGTTTGTLP